MGDLKAFLKVVDSADSTVSDLGNSEVDMLAQYLEAADLAVIRGAQQVVLMDNLKILELDIRSVEAKAA
jgi:hypothetical protein